MNLTSYFSELSLIALQTGAMMLLHRVVSGLKIIYVKHLEHTGLSSSGAVVNARTSFVYAESERCSASTQEASGKHCKGKLY